MSDAASRDLGPVTVSGTYTSEETTDVLAVAAHISAGKAMMRELVDLAGARVIWERELAASPGNAALHFNLAAVTEALGDLEAARRHYEEAVRLAPREEKYARFKGYFEERTPPYRR